MRVTLKLEKVTRNMLRYVEVDDAGNPSKVLTNGIPIYFNQAAINGKPETVTMVVE